MDIPHYVWATCEVEHESLFGFIPAWLEWYRVGFNQGRRVRKASGSRGLYTWVAQGSIGYDRGKVLGDFGFATVPTALTFVEALGWIHNIRVLREWTEKEPGGDDGDRSGCVESLA
jgi:hypothetical protein